MDGRRGRGEGRFTALDRVRIGTVLLFYFWTRVAASGLTLVDLSRPNVDPR